MKKITHATINKTLFSDKHIEMLCNKLGVIFDAIPYLIILIIMAAVIIVGIVWGDFK